MILQQRIRKAIQNKLSAYQQNADHITLSIAMSTKKLKQELARCMQGIQQLLQEAELVSQQHAKQSRGISNQFNSLDDLLKHTKQDQHQHYHYMHKQLDLLEHMIPSQSTSRQQPSTKRNCTQLDDDNHNATTESSDQQQAPHPNISCTIL